MGELAATVMEVRQLGGPRSLFEAAILENGTGMPLFSDMIDQAYGETRWFTDERKARAIEDFRDKWEATCFNLFQEPSQ